MVSRGGELSGEGRTGDDLEDELVREVSHVAGECSLVKCASGTTRRASQADMGGHRVVVALSSCQPSKGSIAPASRAEDDDMLERT